MGKTNTMTTLGRFWLINYMPWYSEVYLKYLIPAKNNSKKLALIAVANKLLKQSLAIAKSGLYYDENFRSNYMKIA